MATQSLYDEALKLRKSGLSYSKIGKIFGFTRQYAHYLLTKVNRDEMKRVEELSYLDFDSLGRVKDVKAVVKNYGNGGRDRAREIVRIRDNHTCKSCGKKWIEGQRRLDVHHIDEDKEGGKTTVRWDLENTHRMITLCHKCHLSLDSVRKKIHKKTH